MAEELTIEDYEKAKAEAEAMKAQLIAKGVQIIDPVTGKPLYKTKTFWANALAFGVMAIGAFGYQLSAEQIGILYGVGFPLLNMALRYLNKDVSGVVS